MKKIVISSNTAWSIYNFRLNLIRSLKNEDYEVVIIAPYDEYAEKLKSEFEYYDVFMNNKGTNPVEDIKTLWNYYNLYKKIKPSIVLNFTIKPNIYGTLVCGLLNIKTINNIAGLGTLFINQNFITKIAKWLYKYSQSKADKIFFQNRDDYEMFIKEGLVEKDKCDILPGSGVDTKKFKPIKIENKDSIFRFLLIARMLWDKGVGEYVGAARLIKKKYENIEFLLLGAVGVDNPKAIPKKQIQKWEDEGIVNYLGVSNDVREYIAKVDCIVLPSYREGTSRVLLESASMTKPIITTNVPGCKEVVENGVNGYLCEVKNAKDLADKMEIMLNLGEEDRTKMGRAGRLKVEKEFDERIVIEQYIAQVRALILSK